MNIRHVVVVRKDLGMSAGLMAAQVAHISDAFMRTRVMDKDEFTPDELSWMKTPYLSVLGVANKEELDEVCKAAKASGIYVHVWKDLIPSENLRRSLPDVVVGASLGPCDYDRLKAIVGTLPLA